MRVALILMTAAVLLLPEVASAKKSFVPLVPNANINSCKTCHTSTAKPPSWNIFGLSVEATLKGGKPDWAAVCHLDSDGDGVSNGVELGDPDCSWTSGTTPGAYLSHPGNKADCPTDCAAKVCGGDGCGGSCGTCDTGSACDADGACIMQCTPDCTDKTCGDDGCGGVCGDCAAGEDCNMFGGCFDPKACTPLCTGKDCGGDGCGGACGTCDAGEICTAGACASDCTPDCTGKACGDDGCGDVCGDCVTGQICEAGACEADPICTPDCTDKACGDDGCGGMCGTCGDSMTCDALSQCVAAPDLDDSGCGASNSGSDSNSFAWMALMILALAVRKSWTSTEA